MRVNLFKIFKPPRIGAVVGVVADRGMAAEAATLIPYDYSYIH